MDNGEHSIESSNGAGNSMTMATLVVGFEAHQGDAPTCKCNPSNPGNLRVKGRQHFSLVPLEQRTIGVSVGQVPPLGTVDSKFRHPDVVNPGLLQVPLKRPSREVALHGEGVPAYVHDRVHVVFDEAPQEGIDAVSLVAYREQRRGPVFQPSPANRSRLFGIEHPVQHATPAAVCREAKIHAPHEVTPPRPPNGRAQVQDGTAVARAKRGQVSFRFRQHEAPATPKIAQGLQPGLVPHGNVTERPVQVRKEVVVSASARLLSQEEQELQTIGTSEFATERLDEAQEHLLTLVHSESMTRCTSQRYPSKPSIRTHRRRGNQSFRRATKNS